MTPVPFWFGVVMSSVGFAIVIYICARLWREWSARLPPHVEQAVLSAYAIQHDVIARGEPDEILNEVATLVRAIRSNAHIGDEASLFALLDQLEQRFSSRDSEE